MSGRVKLCFETPVTGWLPSKRTTLAGLRQKRLANGFGHVLPAGRATQTEADQRGA